MPKKSNSTKFCIKNPWYMSLSWFRNRKKQGESGRHKLCVCSIWIFTETTNCFQLRKSFPGDCAFFEVAQRPMRNKTNVTLGASKIFFSIELRPFFRETIYHSDCNLSYLFYTPRYYFSSLKLPISKSDPEFELQQSMIIY